VEAKFGSPAHGRTVERQTNALVQPLAEVGVVSVNDQNLAPGSAAPSRAAGFPTQA